MDPPTMWRFRVARQVLLTSHILLSYKEFNPFQCLYLIDYTEFFRRVDDGMTTSFSPNLFEKILEVYFQKKALALAPATGPGAVAAPTK
jgi:hypothetical protein